MESSYEERQKVLRDDCRRDGHRFAELVADQTLAPIAVLCDRCGAQWRIHPDDALKDFAQIHTEVVESGR